MQRSATTPVDVNKLKRQLHREVLANPKKAAILGLLVLVAVYFWGPLVWGWIGKDKTSSKPSAEKVPSSDLDPSLSAELATAQAESPAAENPTTHPWEELVEWMQRDPTTTTVEIPDRRDPFRAVVAEVPETALEEDIEPAEQEVTPERAGLVLSGTLVGQDRSVALINGKAYRQGGTVGSTKDGQQIEFTLAEVHPRRVVLERLGERFELVVPQRVRSGQIERAGSVN